MDVFRTQTICFFDSTKDWSGSQKWLLDTATSFHAHYYNVLVCTNINSVLCNRIKETSLKLKAVSVSEFSFLNPIKHFLLFRFFRKTQIDIIVLNLPSDLKLAGVAAKLAGIKIIVYRRGSAIPIKKSFINRFLFSKIITNIIANSQETKKTIRANNPNIFDEHKIEVLYNGIILPEIKPLEQRLINPIKHRKVVIGSAGRLVEQKAFDKLIRVAEILDQRKIDFIILIGGTGKLRKELSTLAIRKNISERIVFIGFVDDINTFMPLIDIFALTSYYEGFGYVLAEAMAHKKPLIAFNTSSNPELISDGFNGYLVQPFDLNEFADKCEFLIKNPTVATQMGNNGRKFVEQKFDFENTFANTKQYIDSLLNV